MSEVATVPHIVLSGDDDYALITVGGRTYKLDAGWKSSGKITSLQVHSFEPQAINVNESIFSSTLRISYTTDEQWDAMRVEREARVRCRSCNSWYIPVVEDAT